MGELIALGVSVLKALLLAVPTMARTFIDIRQAIREVRRAGKKHVRKAVGAGKRRFERERAKRERAKTRRR